MGGWALPAWMCEYSINARKEKQEGESLPPPAESQLKESNKKVHV